MRTARLGASFALWQLLTTPDTAFGQPIQVAGTLDRSFNPNGYWIRTDGSSITGGYPGSIIIDLGGNDFGFSVDAYRLMTDRGRILMGGYTNEGPPSSSNNFALVALTETGSLDRSFNPFGYWIRQNGISITGGYPGSIIIDMGGNELDKSVMTFKSGGSRILIGGYSNAAGSNDFALVALTATGALDKAFNPSGYWISSTGASYLPTAGFGYPGSIVIDLGGNDRGQSMATFQSDGLRTLIGGSTNLGLNPNNFALVALTETGALDRSFNPSGYWISSTGAYIIPPAGFGYPGSLVIDLRGSDAGQSVTTFQSNGERILIGGTSKGNFALLALTQTGSLDQAFNPLGLVVSDAGTYVTGGYPGSITIDLGGSDFGQSVTTFQADGQRILIGGASFDVAANSNFALVVLTETGVLDEAFNPKGWCILANGSTAVGSYPGSILIDLAGYDEYSYAQGNAIGTFKSNGEQIIVGGYTNGGPDGGGYNNNFALIMLTEAGVLDRSFNPSGLWIQASGESTAGGYPGSIIIDLGGSDYGQSVATFASDGTRVLIGGYTTEGPPSSSINFALVVLNGQAIFPSPPPLNPLLYLPFVAMAAA